MPRGGDHPEIGRDALDSPRPLALWTRLFPARRAALGLRASPAPSLAFILFGVVIGPALLGILDPAALVRLDPLVSVALAALGVFVGLGVAAPAQPGEWRLLAAALAAVAVTILIVAPAMHLLLAGWAIPMPTDTWIFALVLGVCASASAATRIPGAGPASRVARIVDLDDAPLVVLGAIVVGLASAGPLLAGLALTVAAGASIGLAGWLLFERATGEAERAVLVAGAIALLGGVGAYAGTSPLLSGAIAALVWAWTPGHADRLIREDLRKLQHPLVALLLIIAGAAIEWSDFLLWVAAPLVLLRLAGKLLASALVMRIGGVPAGLVATVLLPPGVLGVAVALNVQQVSGSATLLLSAVVVAAAVSELLSAFVLPGDLEDDP